MLSKAASSTIFWVFGMTRPEIEPQSPGALRTFYSLGQWAGKKIGFVVIRSAPGLRRHRLSLTLVVHVHSQLSLPVSTAMYIRLAVLPAKIFYSGEVEDEGRVVKMCGLSGAASSGFSAWGNRGGGYWKLSLFCLLPLHTLCLIRPSLAPVPFPSPFTCCSRLCFVMRKCLRSDDLSSKGALHRESVAAGTFTLKELECSSLHMISKPHIYL